MKKLIVAFMCGLLLVGCGKAVEEPVVTEEPPVQDEVVVEEEAPATEEAEADEDYITDLSETLDISGCDTFTQIVDSVLEPGMGYTNEKIGEEDALLVCSGAYDNLDGNMAAIDSTLYIYKDGVPTYIGAVTSNGTAYPLAVKDEVLYVGLFHGVATYIIKDGVLVRSDSAWTEYGTDGSETYYYQKQGEDAAEVDSVDQQTALEEAYAEATILNYDVIK